MKIILKYILNSIKERKLRTLVMFLSVTLSATLLFVTFGIGASYESAQRKMAIGYAGEARIAIMNTENAWITKDEIPAINGIKHIAGLLAADGLYAEDGYYENFDILSADMTDINAINAPRVQSGDLTDFNGYKIALPDRFAGKYGTQVGDTIRLKIDGDDYKFEVAAICAYDTIFLRNTRGFNILIPFETMADILDSKAAYNKILLVIEDNADVNAIKAGLSERMNTDSYRITSVYSEASVTADARQKSMPFYLISFFAMTISAFIIYSSYKIITSERLPVIGTFRSIGAGEKTVKNILMAESLVYGIFGSVLGIPVGYLTLKILLYGMSGTASYGIEIPMVVSVLNILIACGVSIVVSVLGAYIPVKQASKLPVKDVVLGTIEEKPMSNIKIILFGLVLLFVSIILPRVTSGDILTLAGRLSLLTLTVSAIIIIPLLIGAVSYALEKIYGVLFGNVGRLAARNLRGNKSISQNATLLFISISAIIVISVVGGFVQVYIGDVFRGAKLDGFSDATMSAEFVEKIKRLDGIEETLPIRVMNNIIQSGGVTLSRVEGTDDIAEYGEMFAMAYESENDRKRIEAEFGTGRNIILSTDCLARLDVETGDTINLAAGGKSYEYLVIGSIKIRATNTDAIIPSAQAVSDFGIQNYGIVAYTAGNPDAVMAQIRDLLGSQSHWSRTVEEFNSDAHGTIDTFLKPMKNLTWFILLLATVGIINNLLINYIQKRRSIAMYKSVGLSNMQNLKMTILEGFSVGFLGAFLSIFISYMEIKTVFLVAGPRISMEPTLEITTFLFAALMGIAITLIGSIVPIVKGANMKLVEEIKFE